MRFKMEVEVVPAVEYDKLEREARASIEEANRREAEDDRLIGVLRSALATLVDSAQNLAFNVELTTPTVDGERLCRFCGVSTTKIGSHMDCCPVGRVLGAMCEADRLALVSGEDKP